MSYKRIKRRSLPLKVAAIHDLAGYGKSSLTVVIPTLARLGIEVCPLPSAILSTQTDGFTGYSFYDLTKQMAAGVSHWIKTRIKPDVLYTGFLGSEKQIEPVFRLIDYLESEQKDPGFSPLIVVDPVMGDNGELYGPYSRDFIEAMRRLIGRADLITPNLTEAAFLLGEEYPRKNISSDLAEDWSRRLLSGISARVGGNGERAVVITGVPLEAKGGKPTLATVLSYSDSVNEIHTGLFVSPRLSVDFPGTGDYFTSLLIASVLNGDGFKKGVKKAIKKTSCQIALNIKRGRSRREGLAPEIR